MKKAGYDLTGVPTGAPLTNQQRAAFYMPSAKRTYKYN